MATSFPDENKLRHLSIEFSELNQGSCTGPTVGGPQTAELLFEYDKIRYNLYLCFNHFVPDCAENRYLQKIYDATEKDEMEQVYYFAYECGNLFWKFIQEDYNTRKRTSGNTGTLKSYIDHNGVEIVMIQVETVNGVLQAHEHDNRIKYPQCEPVPNPVSNVKIFPPQDIQRLEDIEEEIFKVTIGGRLYCLKTVYRHMEETFLEELKVLASLPAHENLISLQGVVDAGDGKIDGFVIPFIHGSDLGQINCATKTQKERWKNQIEEAVEFLHCRNIIWGDVKPANIMVDHIKDNVVLVDFAGGSTVGWVDAEETGTMEGDRQGLRRVLSFIDRIPEKDQPKVHCS